MPTDRDRIRQLEQRLDEVTGQLEKVSSERLRLVAERDELVRTRDVLAEELQAAKDELADLQTQRPSLTFDQLGIQLREGLAAVDDVETGGPRYQTRAATFELKVAIDTEDDQAVLRLPAIGETVDPGLLGTFRLEIGRATGPDPDLTGMVLVPSLVGATTDGASERLAAAGLTIGETADRPAFGPPGTVIEQDPEGGAYVEPGTSIDLVFAASEVTVPDLDSLTLDAATDRLAALRLGVGAITRNPSEAETGTVIGQEPPAGRSVAVGSSVDLTVAAPPKREVPDLSGLTTTGATDKLTSAELRLGRVDKRTTDGEAGTVIGQQPAAGASVDRGTSVNIVVAKAPVRRARPVPDVVGLRLPEAIRALDEADFTGRVAGTQPFDEQADPESFDTVVEQEPAPRTLIAAPDVRLVVVASGESVEVLRGVGPAMADRLARVGLRTVGDVAHSDLARIAQAMGTSEARAAAVREDALDRNRPAP